MSVSIEIGRHFLPCALNIDQYMCRQMAAHVARNWWGYNPNSVTAWPLPCYKMRGWPSILSFAHYSNRYLIQSPTSSSARRSLMVPTNRRTRAQVRKKEPRRSCIEEHVIDVTDNNCSYFHFNDLPLEMQQYIFLMLPLPTILQLNRVCKEWNRITDGSSSFWHKIFTTRFGSPPCLELSWKERGN